MMRAGHYATLLVLIAILGLGGARAVYAQSAPAGHDVCPPGYQWDYNQHSCVPFSTPSRSTQSSGGDALPPPDPEADARLQQATQQLQDLKMQREVLSSQANDLQQTHTGLQRQLQTLNDQVTTLQSQITSVETANKDALRQLRIAAGSHGATECTFDVGSGCGAPVPFVVVSPGSESVPADAATYIKAIPESIRANPEVSGWLKLYEHLAHVRGALQQQMVAAQAAVTSNPGDEKAKMRVAAISGQLNVAKADEKAAKERLSFHVDEFENPK